jgi:hypothetical protein
MKFGTVVEFDVLLNIGCGANQIFVAMATFFKMAATNLRYCGDSCIHVFNNYILERVFDL